MAVAFWLGERGRILTLCGGRKLENESTVIQCLPGTREFAALSADFDLLRGTRSPESLPLPKFAIHPVSSFILSLLLLREPPPPFTFRLMYSGGEAGLVSVLGGTIGSAFGGAAN